MAWTIEYANTAKNPLHKLDFMDEWVIGRADHRGTGKALAGPLCCLWRYRVGDFRVICDVQDGALRIPVVRLGNRREVYRQAELARSQPRQ